ncbi:THAP domain-containing protein 5-like [Vanessa cardui]|uniref:THAP domain-containing protein 5-like n=1 Tax=Vanessa cardui TaxID=171605 RepID=UPI001F139A7F|nr:THAP domain-containing protein 5-like [Vanessa cardui]
MPSCVFRKCTNYDSKVNKTQGISYHMFPTTEIRLQEWIAIVRKQRSERSWMPSKSSRICSDHFKTTDKYTSNTGRTLLEKNAVPFIEEIPGSRISISPDRSSLPDPDQITTKIKRKRKKLLIIRPSKVSTLDGRWAKIYLKQKERSRKLLQRLRCSRQLCRTLKNKVMLLEDEIKKLKQKPINKSAPLILTLSNDNYEKETIKIRVARSE